MTVHQPDRQRVLVLWSDGRSPNLGVRALAEGARAVAERVWGQPELTFQDFAPNEHGFSLGRNAILGELTRGEISNWVGHFDYVFDTGAGDSFADIYGTKRLLMMRITQRAIAKARVPLVLLPQTIGPFETRLGKRMGAKTLRSAALSFARDTRSASEVNQLGGKLTAKVTDLVFALPQPESEPGFDVAINVSGLLWNENRHVNFQNYRASVHALIDHCLKSGRQVSVVAHVLDNPSDDNDIKAFPDLEMAWKERIRFVTPQSLWEVRRILAAANIVVGSRMHACLNALSVGTPAIGWGYSRKFAPLMSDLGWEHSYDLRTIDQPEYVTATLIDDPALMDSVAAVRTKADQQIELLVNTIKETFA